MIQSRRTYAVVLLLVVTLLVALGIVLWINFGQGVFSNPWANYKSDLLSRIRDDYIDARQLWDSNPVAHYRLTIERVFAYYNDADAPRCQLDLEIEDETVITTYEDTCTSLYASRSTTSEAATSAPLFETTITQLFATIDRDTRRIRWTAQGVGCSFVWLETDYDSQSGYPTRLFYNVSMPDVGGFPIPLKYLDSDDLASGTPGPGCLMIGIFPGPTITISLTPLP